MVVEFLTFRVEPDELDEWLEIEAAHWTAFLSRQRGFVRKEMWRSHDDPTAVHAVIWWESMAAWKSIPQRELDAVADAMGAHERTATCTSFDLLP